MKGFTALPPRTIKVTIRGVELTTRGLSISECKRLGKRFPALDFLKRGIGGINLDKLYESGAEAIAAFIAAGCGYADDPEQEKAAAGLTVAEQLELIIAILNMSTAGIQQPEPRRHIPLLGKWR